MKCKFRSCDKEAMKGWTNCKRHYSAGCSRKHYRMAQDQKRQRQDRGGSR